MGWCAEGNCTLSGNEWTERLLRFFEQKFKLVIIKHVGQNPAFDIGVNPGLDRRKTGGSGIGLNCNVWQSISRGLLAERLRRLQRMGVVEKLEWGKGPRQTEYQLTQAGWELQAVIESLLTWGARWAFGEPEMNDLDPILLLWWMRSRVCVEQLPQQRVVVQFDFKGAVDESYWLVLTKEDVSVCLTHPGFDLDVLVTADLAAFYRIWLGHMDFNTARSKGLVKIEAIPALVQAFPNWFAYSHAADTVRAALAEMAVEK
ncbi:MAG: winged helix-turn-helix transcriptional regulator [Anaerolineales bacterium]|nr:winged helix-turn-helix transcriptional regulator [Anaerolineales bacterium]